MSAQTQERIASVRAANGILCGFLAKSGELWIGTNQGAYRYEGESFTPFTNEESQALEPIQFFVEDANGKLWLGGSKGSLFQYDGERLVDHSLQVNKPSRFAK